MIAAQDPIMQRIFKEKIEAMPENDMTYIGLHNTVEKVIGSSSNLAIFTVLSEIKNLKEYPCSKFYLSNSP